MIKLIGIELKKIFKHKSLYFIFIIISIFLLFNNILYKLDYDSDGRYKYDDTIDIDKDIKELSIEISKYDINNRNDINIYVTKKSKLDVLKGMKKYNINSWQFIKYDEYLYNYLYDINYYTYIEKNKNMLDKVTNKYNNIIKYFNDNNWKYFVNLEKYKLVKELNDINNSIKNTQDKELLDNLKINKKTIDYNLSIVNYRIDKDISYSNNYLNRALIEYQDGIIELDKYKSKKLTHNDYLKYNKLVTNININKYIINNKVNINKENNLNYQLRNICSDYELFIVLIILIVVGIMIGEEFSKGTIKLLLIKPYSRNKILFSKFFSGIVIIIITILYLIINQLIFGGICFGISSLDINIPVYDLNMGQLRELNIFIYMLVYVMAKLPMFIMLLIISFFFSLFIINSIGSFAIVMIIYTFSSVINNLVINYKIKIFSYFITLNWDFTNYLFGNINNLSYLNFKKSFFIYLFYVIILLSGVFINFNKKNIKNV